MIVCVDVSSLEIPEFNEIILGNKSFLILVFFFFGYGNKISYSISHFK